MSKNTLPGTKLSRKASVLYSSWSPLIKFPPEVIIHFLPLSGPDLIFTYIPLKRTFKECLRFICSFSLVFTAFSNIYAAVRILDSGDLSGADAEIFVKQRKGIGKVVNHNNLVLTKSDYP